MYTLDTTAARKADTIGAYLSETGKYVGHFLRAEKLISQSKGTHGIGFTFKADDGRETRFDVWTMKANNEPLSGMNQINAMMACLALPGLKESTQRVKKWDATQGAEAIMEATCFADLMNKPIGLLLRSEEYEKMKDGHKTGETAWRMNLFACFQAGTELMASEILDRKTSPEQLPKALGALADKPLKKQTGGGNSHAPSHSGGGGSMMDDDIPFSQACARSAWAI
jgi:predicted metal-binding protein